MGLIDDIETYTDSVDLSAEKMPRGYGFDPNVCKGCPHRQTETKGQPCGICGCPTLSGFPMDMLGMPPEGCIRLEQHEGK